MSKTKIISVIIIAIMLCGICLLMAGCPAKEPEDKKYDVWMKIVCQEIVNGKTTGPILGEWIFSPDESEMHIEREYDGKQYKYYIDKYSIPDHPTLSGNWLALNGSGSNVFHTGMMIEGHIAGTPAPKYVCERGKYCYTFRAQSTSTIWRYRVARLYVDVK